MDPLEADLQRVAILKKNEVGQLFQGERLVKTHAMSMLDLLREATAARFRLAKLHHYQAATASAQKDYRCAISRAYYAMYQSMRAVVFLVTQGDDHEEHSKLPSNIPDDFPNKATWANELKTARLTRNAADYDPYPTDSASWEAKSKDILKNAQSILSVAEAYLVGKGVTL